LCDGHDALTQPLLGDPGFTETSETEAITINEMCGIENMRADNCMGETAGVTEQLALSRHEEQNPDGTEYPNGETEYIFYLHSTLTMTNSCPWNLSADNIRNQLLLKNLAIVSAVILRAIKAAYSASSI